MAKVLGDNGGVSEGTFFHHDRIFVDLKKQASAIAGKMRAAKAAALDDGLDFDAYKWAVKQRSMTLEQQRQSHNNRMMYQKFFKMPIAEKLAQIDEMKDEVGLSDDERQKKWEDEGYVVGARGGNRTECPHPDPNSMGARFWMAGYDKGQAKLAPKKKAATAAPVADGPGAADTGGVADAGRAPAATGPKDEPEVAAAKAKKARTKGVTYWHNAQLGKVYEIDTSQTDPVGAVSITKPEFLKLQAEYAKAEEDDWNSKAETAAATAATSANDGDGDGDEDEDPPGESVKH